MDCNVVDTCPLPTITKSPDRLEVQKLKWAAMSAKLPFKRRSVASPVSYHNNNSSSSKQQPQSPSVSAAKRAASPALLRLATAQASSARQQQQQSKPESSSTNFATPVGTPANSARRQSQQQQQQQFRSPGVRFSTPAAPRASSSLSTQSQQQQQNRSLTSMPKRVPMARKSTDLLRIRDPELRFLALLNSPMIDSRPRGRRSMALASRAGVGVGGDTSRHSICCLPSSPASPSATSPMRPPRLTQPAGEDGTSPQAVWRTLFCDDVEEADEESGEDAHEKATAAANNIDLKEAVGKYRMLLHHQWELLRFLIDDWKEVSASESVPPELSPSLDAALAAVSRLTRETLPRFEAGLQTASSAAALHAAWSGVETDIVAVRQKFAELEASRLGGWPPLAAAAVGVADGGGGDNRRVNAQRHQVRRSLRVA